MTQQMHTWSQAQITQVNQSALMEELLDCINICLRYSPNDTMIDEMLTRLNRVEHILGN